MNRFLDIFIQQYEYEAWFIDSDYEEEEWLVIPGFPRYMISNFGRVWSTIREQFLKPHPDKDGYLYVMLYNNGIGTNKWIHRLIAENFIPVETGRDQVNHDDGNKQNNSIDNLEWCTLTENRRHAFRTGLQHSPSARCVKIIETGEVFDSLVDCARSINGNRSCISMCLSGIHKTHKGYTFEYAD